MSILYGPFSTLLVALMFSGADKVIRPAPAAGALIAGRLVPGSRARRVRRSRALARLLGVVEIVIGGGVAATLLVGASVGSAVAIGPGLVAVTYVGFAWFLRRIDAGAPGASCGCFGGSTTAGPLHIGATIVAAGIAAATAVVMAGSSTSALRRLLVEPATAIPFLGAVTIGALLFLLAPSLVTELRRATQPPRTSVATFSISEPIRR